MPGAILVSGGSSALAPRCAGAGRPLAVLRGEVLDGDAGEVGRLLPATSSRMTPALARALHQAPELPAPRFAAGVDHPFFQRLLARGVRITTSSGAAAVPIAHTVLLYLLALSRDLPGWARDQAARRWNPRDVEDLQGRRLAVLGLGPIGLEVARLARALRMDVVGVRRTPRGDEPCETWPLARLDGLLPQVGVVLALLTDETRHLLDARRLALAARRDQRHRGTRRQAALAAALGSGRRGAGPTCSSWAAPPESPLWSQPRVIVTPRARLRPQQRPRAAEMFAENAGASCAAGRSATGAAPSRHRAARTRPPGGPPAYRAQPASQGVRLAARDQRDGDEVIIVSGTTNSSGRAEPCGAMLMAADGWSHVRRRSRRGRAPLEAQDAVCAP
jgi:phosphoglycerate dehydrogenase-like enzyme